MFGRLSCPCPVSFEKGEPDMGAGEQSAKPQGTPTKSSRAESVDSRSRDGSEAKLHTAYTDTLHHQTRNTQHHHAEEPGSTEAAMAKASRFPLMIFPLMQRTAVEDIPQLRLSLT